MPHEPIENVVERLLDGDHHSRREFVRRLGAMGAFASAGAFLAACGGVSGTETTQSKKEAAAPANHPKTAIGTLVVSNWPLYIDKKTPKGWEQKYNANLKYTEDVNDNEEFFAKVRQELEAGKSIGRDLTVLTDYMAARWIDAGYAEKLDKRNIPNAKNLLPSLQHPPFDKNRDYTLPWQSGMTGIGYDPDKTGGKLSSINDLFNPKFKGRVSFLTEWRDSGGLVMLGMGIDASKASKADVQKAFDKIDEANKAGQIRRFTGNDYAKDLAAGNLWACVAWSGDIVQLQADNPRLQFLIPDEGAMAWSDNMLIPQKAGQPYGAETWMDYYYDPKVAAQLAAYVNYFCPVTGAKEEMQKIDPELASNQLIFPDDSTQSKLHAAPSLSLADERELTAQFQTITGA
ncbi:MAG TPA: spermidine/putrescine ABC transporter substrate-binding protein [Solirubrobacteraceae bacterium]|nr:spermidine/putrescine ABC transporter substrate-binding protein [Solirubrobacteraceae bacterium]